MADTLANILAGYGEGYRSPALTGDSEIYDTSNVLGRMRQDSAATRGMRGLADLLQRDSVPENVLAGGINTAANWLDQRPEVGADTLAPLGLSALGSAPAGALAANTFRRSPELPAIWRQAHPSTSVNARLHGERIGKNATAYGDDVFVSPNIHGGEEEEAAKVLGYGRFLAFMRDKDGNGPTPGWLTTTGRFLDRHEANALADATLGKIEGTRSPPNKIGLESYALIEQTMQAYQRAKAAGDTQAMAQHAADYRRLSSTLEDHVDAIVSGDTPWPR